LIKPIRTINATVSSRLFPQLFHLPVNTLLGRRVISYVTVTCSCHTHILPIRTGPKRPKRKVRKLRQIPQKLCIRFHKDPEGAGGQRWLQTDEGNCWVVIGYS